jgi:hypothetical protein
MKQIKSNSELEKLKNNYYSIFKGFNPFGKVFQDDIDIKGVLCPVDGYYLNEEQFLAIVHATKVTGETKIFISEVEIELDPFFQSNSDKAFNCSHWELNLPVTYNEYRSLPIFIENAIYSPLGQWGLIVSHEEHAVIGGHNSFMKAFKQKYEKLNQDLLTFKKIWNTNTTEFKSNIDWFKEFIDYIER